MLPMLHTQHTHTLVLGPRIADSARLLGNISKTVINLDSPDLKRKQLLLFYPPFSP